MSTTDPRYEPRYTVQAAADLVRIHPRTVSDWLQRDGRTSRLATFEDLIALELMKRLREEHMIAPKRARDAVSEIVNRWSLLGGAPQLRVANGALWAEPEQGQFDELGTMGQQAIPEVVRHVSQNLEIDEKGKVARWYPLDGNRRVVVDPLVRWGNPTVRGTRIPTWALFDAWRDHGSSRDAFVQVANNFKVAVEDVEAAVALEGCSTAVAA